MDFVGLIYMGLGFCGVLLSLFGWSHNNLSKRLDKLAIDLQARKTDADIRVLINDKIEPYRVELKNLSKQLDIISHQYADLDRKIDSVINTLSKNAV